MNDSRFMKAADIQEILGVSDSMPSLGMLTVNALACAGSVLIPVQPAYLPVRGLQQLIRTIYTVKRRLNSALTIEGILFTMSLIRRRVSQKAFGLRTRNVRETDQKRIRILMRRTMTNMERRTSLMGKLSFRPQLAAAAMLSAVLAGSFPVTAFANTGKEADCICETRCGEESVNEECPVCRNDIALCQARSRRKQRKARRQRRNLRRNPRSRSRQTEI